MKSIRIASLFCGCGGTDVGLLGGFDFLGKHYPKNKCRIVFANDVDSKITSIYDQNFTTKATVKDIHELNSASVPDADLIVGGFPCQAFSVIAQNPKRLGIKSPIGTLFFEMCRIIKDKKPLVFMAENVKGILSANKSEAFPLIIKEFESCGYAVSWSVLNASYLGIPQKRERVIIVGVRKDLNLTFSFEKISIIRKKIVPIKSVLENNISEKYFFSEKAVNGMLKTKERMNKGRIQNLNEPSNTVTAHLCKVSLNSTDPVLLIDDRYRRYTPREVARIQSFPDSFILTGPESIQYKALGNAVAPIMAWTVFREIYRQVFSKIKECE